MYEKSWKDLIRVPKRASSCLSARRVQKPDKVWMLGESKKPDKTLAVSHPSASNRNCQKRWWCKMRLRFTPREGIKPDKLQVDVSAARYLMLLCLLPSPRLKSQLKLCGFGVYLHSFSFSGRRLSFIIVLPTPGLCCLFRVSSFS